ncbi:MAG: 50S ribosomal protein L6 [Spirochaetaceae bacterium]|nr:50S ribosomal protein L6 [Spirochaetaceae bacterium]
MSRLGKLPVSIPAGVKISVNDNVVTVEGPKGKLSQKFDNVDIKVSGSDIEVTRKDDSRAARAAHGLYRNLIKNMVTGVSTGFTKSLIINGVGYRAEVQGKTIVMNLGFSTDFIALIPEGLTVTADAQGKVTITGIDKQLVGEFAAEIRSLRKPEPYKGKGIRYENEYIRRKVGKSGVK